MFVSPLSADDVGYRDEALKRLAILERKVVGLAEAMPADKFTWAAHRRNPQRGRGESSRCRSQLQYYAKVCTPAPEGFEYGGFEKSTTSKAEVVAKLKGSFSHIRKAIENLSAPTAESRPSTPETKTTYLGTCWRSLEHISEHLGQLITYARLNGVTPPWS